MLSFKYGNGVVTMQAAGASQIVKLLPQTGIPLQNVGQTFVDAASQGCISSPGLNTLVSPTDLFTIVLPTAQGHGNPALVLPFLTYYLTSLGVPEKNIAILAAGFEAPPQTAAGLVPPHLAQTVQTVIHSSEGPGLVSLGETAGKTPVSVHPLLQGRRVILLDVVKPDLILGFRGGPATLLSACGSDTIRSCLRKAFLPGTAELSPKAASCFLSGNPVAEELTTIGALVNPLFSVNLLEDGQGRLCRIVCGRWLESWYQSGALFQREHGTPVKAPADVVAASCGGYPGDASFQSACAGIVHAAQAAKPGGTVLLTAECREGGGPDLYLHQLETLQVSSFPQKLLDAPTLFGLHLLCALGYLGTRRVLMQSKINTQTLLLLGIEGFRTMETMEAKVDFRQKSTCFIPDATHFFPYSC